LKGSQIQRNDGAPESSDFDSLEFDDKSVRHYIGAGLRTGKQ